MIKVNLLRNRVEDTTTRQMSTGANTEQREALIKIVIMTLATVALIAYDHTRLNSLNRQLMTLNNQANQLQAKAAQYANETLQNKGIQGKAQELQDKLQVIKLLSKLRLRQIKTLDFIQSSIPARVWLTNVKYSSDRLHPQSGEYEFSGDAVSTADLGQFIQRLNGSAYLQDVIVVQNKEIQYAGQSDSLVRDFHFIANVGDEN